MDSILQLTQHYTQAVEGCHADTKCVPVNTTHFLYIYHLSLKQQLAIRNTYVAY